MLRESRSKSKNMPLLLNKNLSFLGLYLFSKIKIYSKFFLPVSGRMGSIFLLLGSNEGMVHIYLMQFIITNGLKSEVIRH